MATQSLRNPNRRPTQPGAVLRKDVLPALKMTHTVTPDMAMRLGKAPGNGPQIWLRTQQTIDLWELAQCNTYHSIKTLELV
ncbi:MAG: hypothetical protein RL258_1331 [Pseudomonadota bacterium]|jgi:plasmid maintenance system antidote protein VapI